MSSPVHRTPASPAATWEERHPGNVCGRAAALTTLAPMSAWGERRLRFTLSLRRLMPRWLQLLAAKPLIDLSFIHYAQWAFFRRSRSTYLLFETNFNGSFDAYIDAFSYVIPKRMKTFFGGCYGFPGPDPSGPFKAYIERHAFEAAHYYSAYPEATVTMVRAGLQIDAELTKFMRAADGVDDEQFAEHWRRFLTEVQGCL